MHGSNWFLKRYFQNIHQDLAGAASGASAAGAAAEAPEAAPVSYTHLTLPTILRV